MVLILKSNVVQSDALKVYFELTSYVAVDSHYFLTIQRASLGPVRHADTGLTPFLYAHFQAALRAPPGRASTAARLTGLSAMLPAASGDGHQGVRLVEAVRRAGGGEWDCGWTEWFRR